MSTEIPVPVQVDPDDGRWSVEGIPMVLVPRHMLVNNLEAAENQLGQPGSAALIRAAGYRSAQEWCTQQGRFHRLDPDLVVEHYLEQLSRRGWGLFRIEQLDHAKGKIQVSLRYSALAERAEGIGYTSCYMFEAWLEGAFDFAAASMGRAHRYAFAETSCRSIDAAFCVFHGSPTPREVSDVSLVSDHQ